MSGVKATYWVHVRSGLSIEYRYERTRFVGVHAIVDCSNGRMIGHVHRASKKLENGRYPWTFTPEGVGRRAEGPWTSRRDAAVAMVCEVFSQ